MAAAAEFSAAALSVAATATLINAADDSDLGSDAGQSMLVKNVGVVTIYLGGSGVTTAQGFPLEPNESVPVHSGATGASLYGIVASGTCAARLLYGNV